MQYHMVIQSQLISKSLGSNVFGKNLKKGHKQQKATKLTEPLHSELFSTYYKSTESNLTNQSIYACYLERTILLWK